MLIKPLHLPSYLLSAVFHKFTENYIRLLIRGIGFVLLITCLSLNCIAADDEDLDFLERPSDFTCYYEAAYERNDIGALKRFSNINLSPEWLENNCELALNIYNFLLLQPEDQFSKDEADRVLGRVIDMLKEKPTIDHFDATQRGLKLIKLARIKSPAAVKRAFSCDKLSERLSITEAGRAAAAIENEEISTVAPAA